MPASNANDDLFDEHEYLANQHRHHNWLIHGTWYLDIIFMGAILQFVISNSLSVTTMVVVSLFAVLVFLSLGTYSFLQILERERVKTRKNQIGVQLNYGYTRDEYRAQRWNELVTPKTAGLLFFFYQLPLAIALGFIFLGIASMF